MQNFNRYRLKILNFFCWSLFLILNKIFHFLFHCLCTFQFETVYDSLVKKLNLWSFSKEFSFFIKLILSFLLESILIRSMQLHLFYHHWATYLFIRSNTLELFKNIVLGIYFKALEHHSKYTYINYLKFNWIYVDYLLSKLYK